MEQQTEEIRNTQSLNNNALLDRSFLLHAIELARLGYGRVSPNPYVGAVLVKEGTIIGEGYHKCAGKAHAEVNAINDALEKGHAVEGATLYITLEPCCFKGKTPACTDLILKSGIKRVVTAIEDPNPQVAGNGHLILKNAGIEVETNLLVSEGLALIRVFMMNQTLKRPFVTLKAALSLDGKLATKTKDSKWITGEAARKKGHFYRGMNDVILVGKGTLLADDPALNVRYGFHTNPPLRMVLLNNFEGITPEIVRHYQFFNTEIAPSTICFDQRNPPSLVLQNLCTAQGVKMVALSDTSPKTVLNYCFENGLMSVYIEGGAAIYDAFISADLVDAYLLFYGPKLIGSPDALELWRSSDIKNLKDSPSLTIDSVEQLDESILTIVTRRR